jgi:hypothetical protein
MPNVEEGKKVMAPMGPSYGYQPQDAAEAQKYTNREWTRDVPWWHPRRFLLGQRWRYVLYARSAWDNTTYLYATDKQRAKAALAEQFDETPPPARQAPKRSQRARK